jgi:hypothetical protein
MYKIIGADQKEYGPVSAELIRQWIAEGRANAQTQVLAEGASAWQPLSAFPEFADALGLAPGAPPPFSAGTPAGAAGAAPTEEELLARDYSLDIGSCISRSWRLATGNFGPLLGISVLVLLALGGTNQIIGMFSTRAWEELIARGHISAGGALAIGATMVISLPISSIFMGGLAWYYLKSIRGEAATLGDAFSGFGPRLGQLVLLGLVQGLLTYLAFFLCVLPCIYVSVAWCFTTALVMDRRMNFWGAMELSRRVVSRHWFTVFGLMLVAGLVSACGLLACCVGLLLSVPIGMLALIYAYEDLVGRQNR